MFQALGLQQLAGAAQFLQPRAEFVLDGADRPVEGRPGGDVVASREDGRGRQTTENSYNFV